jgi:hypothetical protein
MSIESGVDRLRDSGRLRASDGEREQIATIVREAVGEGRLTISEGDERLSSIYAAKFQDELSPLVGDLPAGQAMARKGAPSGQSGGRWSQSPADNWEYRRRAWRGRYRGGIPGALAHFGFVAMIAAGLTLLWVLSGVHFFWPAIPLFFLVLGLGRHWRYAAWRRHWDNDRA